MITITVAELLQAREAGKEFADLHLSMQAAYDFARLMRVVDLELQTYDEQRQRLFAEYGEERAATDVERQATGNLRVTAIKPEHGAVFAAKLDALLRCTVELDRAPFNLAAVVGLTVKPRTVLALWPLLMMPGTDDVR